MIRHPRPNSTVFMHFKPKMFAAILVGALLVNGLIASVEDGELIKYALANGRALHAISD